MITKNIAPGIGQEWSEQGAKSAGDAVSAPLTDDQLGILAHTCAVIDTILGLLDVPTLWAAEKVAVALMRADRAGD